MLVEPFSLAVGDLVLDQPTRADVPLITEYCQDPLFERFMTVPWPYQRQHAEYFVDEYVPRGWASGGEVTWALRSQGEFLGVIGLRRPNSMIGFWLGAPHRSMGWMPLALGTVADGAFEVGYADPVLWECVVGNVASLAVARKAGFTFTGTGPALVTARDGSAPTSLQAALRSTDSREPKPGWPAT